MVSPRGTTRNVTSTSSTPQARASERRNHPARAPRGRQAHDSTVKFRPVDPARLGSKWRKFRDFKIEVDASEKGMILSASFSMPARKGRIKRVAAGKLGVGGLLT